MHTHTHKHSLTHTHGCIYIYIYTYIYTNTHTHIHTHTHRCERLSPSETTICMYVHMCILIYIHTHANTHTHTHRWESLSPEDPFRWSLKLHLLPSHGRPMRTRSETRFFFFYKFLLENYCFTIINTGHATRTSPLELFIHIYIDIYMYMYVYYIYIYTHTHTYIHTYIHIQPQQRARTLDAQYCSNTASTVKQTRTTSIQYYQASRTVCSNAQLQPSNAQLQQCAWIQPLGSWSIQGSCGLRPWLKATNAHVD